MKACETIGAACDGAVKLKAKPLDEPPKPKPVADKLVHAETARLLEGQKITVKDYRKKFAEVREKITPPNKKHLL